MPWLVNEDSALKYQLQGIRVFDGNSGEQGRNVPVRFINLEDELVGFHPPVILISMPNISLAPERMQAGGLSMLPGTFKTQLPYVPEGIPRDPNDPYYQDHNPSWTSAVASANPYNPSDSPYFADVQPYHLDYQITVMTRLHRQHMNPILAALEMPDKLGRNSTLAIPQDGTFRQMYRMGGPEPRTLSFKDGPLQKRLFTATYMVRVESEVVGPVFDTSTANAFGIVDDIQLDIAYAVAAANTDLSPYYTEEDLSPVEAAASIGILGVRQDITWNTDSGD